MAFIFIPMELFKMQGGGGSSCRGEGERGPTYYFSIRAEAKSHLRRAFWRKKKSEVLGVLLSVKSSSILQ